MALRWGPGPVFAYECLTNARRWQLFALRTLSAALPGITLALVCWVNLGGHPLTRSKLAATGESFFFLFVSAQLALILLAAPAYTAGAICLDKERGTLLHILATDLSNSEIILGKLAVRLLAVVGLVIAPVPVLFGAILLGGIDPAAAIGSVLVALGVAVAASTLALTLSVWMRKTYEVLLLVYLLLVLFLLVVPIWMGLSIAWTIAPPPYAVKLANPFWLAYLPYLFPDTSWIDEQAIFLAVALVLSALLTLVAILRIRTVALRQTGRAQRRRRRFPLPALPGPSLDFNPVLWREWHRKHASRWSRFVWFLYGAVALILSVLSVVESLKGGWNRVIAPLVNALQVPLGLLLLSVGSVTSLAEERVRGSLDILLTTPLSTLQILVGKWWGAYRPVLLLTVLPAIVAATSAWPPNRHGVGVVIGLILAYGALVTSLGVALAIWISRPGRAHVLSVIVFVLMTVGPLFSDVLLNDPDSAFLMQASPLFEMGQLTFSLIDWPYQPSNSDSIMLRGVVWMFLYFAAAVLFFLLSLWTFVRYLGRVRRR